MNACPLLVLGGFPGCGKTTLIGRWLMEPGFSETAIIVGDAGDPALDAHLVAGGKLPAGASVRGTAGQGFAAALAGLARDRRRDKVPPFERVIVEAGRCHDPAAMLDELAADAGLAELYPVHGLVAAVDALDARTDTARAADAIVITKADLADASATEGIARSLVLVNPDAEIVRSPAPAGEVWNAAGNAPGREVRRLRAALRADDAAQAGIGSLRLCFPHAIELSGFCVRLAAFLEVHAGQVLRVKGLVRVEGRHGPAVIQAVGRRLYPVRTLKEWPAGLDDSALVVTAVGLADDAIRMGIAGDAPELSMFFRQT